MRVFVLDSRLAADSVELGRLSACQVRLMDDMRWPWLILVPMRPGLSEIHDLAAQDLPLVANDISLASARLKTATGALKINIGALGNIVKQLHIHVIARDEADPAWPGPVWGFGTRQPYLDQARAVAAETYGKAVLEGGSRQ
jgi:diadenosine tetraphosphate (Ap4A) HIT family hydrolase